MFKKNRSWLGLGCFVVLVVSVFSPATAQEGDAMSPEMMQAWMKAISPGEHHEHYKAAVGKWKTEIRAWMQPGAEPTKMSGVSEYEMVMGGRYLQQKMSTEMMGMPYEGFGLSGYDNLVGKHTVMWVDTMGTSMTYGEGDCSDDHRTETILADVRDPMAGGVIKAKMVTRFESDDKHVFEYYVIGPDGSETKALEIVYTRM